ncbi:hypothetical protein V1478_007520 [Vespula squamosa]|uniref:Uncharacterized protein n=1 Tax=Vespula squamosa TaxID=30214 RepID=A0ABD2B3C8_VESSQ
MVATSLLLLTPSIYTSWFRIVALCRDIRTELTSLMTGLKQSLWSLRGCETVSSKLHCPGSSSDGGDGSDGGSLTRFNPISYHEFPWFLRWLVGHYARATDLVLLIIESFCKK